MDIVKLLLAAPGLDVNAAKVSCASGMHLHAVISHCCARCEPVVWQEGWVRGRVILEVDCVGGGLLLLLLCAGGWMDFTDVGVRKRSHGHCETATCGTSLERKCRQGELCVGDAWACCDQSVLSSLRA